MGQSRQIILDFKPLKRIKVHRTYRSFNLRHIAWCRLDVWKRQKTWIRHGKRLVPKAKLYRLATERVVTWSRTGVVLPFLIFILASWFPCIRKLKASPLCYCKVVDNWNCHSDELPLGRVAARTSCHAEELPLGRVAARTSCHSDELPPGRALARTSCHPDARTASCPELVHGR